MGFAVRPPARAPLVLPSGREHACLRPKGFAVRPPRRVQYVQAAKRSGFGYPPKRLRNANTLAT